VSSFESKDEGFPTLLYTDSNNGKDGVHAIAATTGV